VADFLAGAVMSVGGYVGNSDGDCEIRQPEVTAAELLKLLEQCRPYLLAIAQAELPTNLQGKIGASDLVQETLARGVERWGTFQGSRPEEFARWLRTILRNQLANVKAAYGTDMRAVGREQPVDSALIDLLVDSPSVELQRRECEAHLEAALSNLPSDYRRVVQLRYLERRSFAEIGAELGRSETAVSKVWARALHQLQQELGPLLSDS
jgi:RNA polymerase sigma-70 factor (ECF subfamily)